MTYPVTLAASFRTTADQLELDYVVSNGSREPVFLIDVSIRVTAEGVAVEPGAPRVELAGNSVVLLRSALRPIPPNVTYAVPPQAYATRLEPGGTIRRSLRLPLPLAPAGLPPKREPKQAVFERVTFLLGVVPSSAVPGVQRQEIGGTEVWLLPVDAVDHQVELRAEARVANLRVLVER
ncbi:MAG: hypothetical protein RMI94_03920 [Bryobacterales bacterium]|nr:hypothetical protein [Bryobacteraceae bacterium]MDW8129671.1 hypothetical protein [Bryobacterales bacterium]